MAAALRRPPRRRDWRLGRYAVKRVVAGRLGLGTGATSLATIEVVAAADGAAAVCGGCGGSRAAW